MTISITARLRPFSHRPGARCVLPGSHWKIEAFPTLLRIGDIDVPLEVTGPVRNFTLQQDLEKNCAWVFGDAQEGFYRIKVEAKEEGFELFFDRFPHAKRRKEKKFFPREITFFLPQYWERLSLGSHKAQDWDLVRRRLDLKEILPVLFGLGQKIPRLPPQPLRGTARLLEVPKDPKQILPAFEAIFLAAFHEIAVPRLNDDEHQGLCPEEAEVGHPFFLLQETEKRIRALFFSQDERRLSFLPSSPFAAGRMIDVQVEGVGSLDFEWAKGIPRRIVFRASTSGEVVLLFPKGVTSFRAEKKKRKAEEPLLLEAGKTYLLDRFQ